MIPIFDPKPILNFIIWIISNYFHILCVPTLHELNERICRQLHINFGKICAYFSIAALYQFLFWLRGTFLEGSTFQTQTLRCPYYPYRKESGSVNILLDILSALSRGTIKGTVMEGLHKLFNVWLSWYRSH